MTTTLITGANKGLGYETARQLVAAGHTVYVGARSEDNARRAAKELDALPLLLDVTDEASVLAAADRLAGEHEALDVLVNNAGIATERKPVEEYTGEEVSAVLDTNLVGVVRVTRAFLPLLRRSGNGVIVNVGSSLGSLARVQDPERMESTIPNLAYTASKAALSMVTVQYAKAFPELRVNVVDPGYTATDINGFLGVKTVEQGAAAIVTAALLTADGPTGSFFDDQGACPW